MHFSRVNQDVFHNPNGITVISKSPAWVVNGVISLDSSLIPTFQYPDAKSSDVKNFASASRSKESSMRGNG